MGIPDIPSYIEFGEKAEAVIRQSILDKEKEKHTKYQETARRNPNLYLFLKYMYEKSLNVLEINGHTYPAAVFPAPRSQWEQPESVLGKLIDVDNEQFNKCLKDSGNRYLKFMENFNPEKNLTDEETFRMIQLRTTNEIKIDCAIGNYFDSIKTCESLANEILTLCAKTKLEPNPESFEKFSSHLKLRSELHRAVENPAKDGSGRSVAIGGEVLTVFNTDKGYHALLLQRSSRGVAINPNQLDVAPGFMFQPMMDQEKEYSITHNTYREYLEELFNVEELRGTSRPYNWFYSHPNLLYLKKLFDKKKAELLFTGVVIDLLNLRPDICLLLLIHDPEWYEVCSRGDPKKGIKPMETNDEFKSYTEMMNEKKKLKKEIPLVNFELPPTVKAGKTSIDLRDPAVWTPSGIGALHLGLKVVKSKFGVAN